MNIVKNMEAVFVAVILLAGVATFATAKVEPKAAGPQASTQEKMSTVVVTTKRLTAAQKARLDS